MEIFNTLFKYLTSTEAKLSAKSMIILGAIMLVLLTDNIFGFSTYYSAQKKIEVAKDASELLKEENLSIQARENLLEIREEALSRRNWFEFSYAWLQARYWNKPKYKTINTNGTLQKEVIKQKDPRSDFWHVMSSAGIFVVFFVFMVIVIAFAPTTDKKFTVSARIAVMIFISLFGIGLIYLLSLLLGIIPKIGETWFWNYILNCILQVLFVFTPIKALSDLHTRLQKPA